MKRSSLAEPPIAVGECNVLQVAICRFHDGRIGFSPAAGDEFGNVYFCPVGGMYWRYTQRRSGMLTPMKFPKGL